MISGNSERDGEDLNFGGYLYVADGKPIKGFRLLPLTEQMKSLMDFPPPDRKPAEIFKESRNADERIFVSKVCLLSYRIIFVASNQRTTRKARSSW